MLILVPPSRKVDFLFQGSCPQENVRSHLRVLRASAKDDVFQRNQLLRLCNLVVSPPALRYSYLDNLGKEEDSARRENRELVAIVAIELGQFDLYDSAVSAASENLLSIECARALGLALEKNGLDKIKPR